MELVSIHLKVEPELKERIFKAYTKLNELSQISFYDYQKFCLQAILEKLETLEKEKK